MTIINEYPRDSSVSVCIHGLKEDCSNDVVNDADVQASVLSEDQSTVLTGPITIPSLGSNGDYQGVIPAFDLESNEYVYVKLRIFKSTSFQSIILEPHVVVDRRSE